MGQPAASNEPYFDAAKVDAVVSFIECLTLTKCTKSLEPEPFEVLPHTQRIVEGIYGWRRPDGRRLVRKCFATFGRKQAKTQIAAAIAMYEFFMGEEPMQEIYFSATSADQAAKCYEAIRDMIYADPEFSGLVDITPSRRQIVNTANGNLMLVLSADGKKQHGSNPSLVVFDELHVWGAMHRELHSALSTGSKSRRQPLWLTITTAGTDDESLWGEEYAYAKSVESGEVSDPSYLPIIYEVPREADWTDQSLWHLALPLLETGHQSLEDYDSDFKAALQRPEKQNEFRRLYLNQKTATVSQWIPISAWDDCAEEHPVPYDELVGLECWAGLDLGNTGDFSGLVLAFRKSEEEIITRAWAYLPMATLDARQVRDGIQYRYWVERGWMKTTPGKTTDYRVVFAHLEELHAKFDIKCLAYDRWRAEYIEDRCEEIQLPLMKFGQGYASMSPAIEVVEPLIYNKRLRHDGNLCLRWNIDCTQIRTDDAGNKKFVKPQIHQKSKHIDLTVAATMAVGSMCLMRTPLDPYSNGARLVAL